jgi:hypothetical protein
MLYLPWRGHRLLKPVASLVALLIAAGHVRIAAVVRVGDHPSPPVRAYPVTVGALVAVVASERGEEVPGRGVALHVFGVHVVGAVK